MKTTDEALSDDESDNRAFLLQMLLEEELLRADSLITICARDEPILPSFAQQRLWFLAQLEGVSEAYHIPLGLRLRGDLNESALRRALDCLVARHETLRTSFYTKDGELYQRIGAEDAGFTLRFEDLSGRADGAEELVRQIREEGTHPFDLEQGPLIRGRLLRLGDQEHVLLITMHHIVSDGWSMGILSRELGALYEAYSLGKPDPLAPLEIQYADYASWQRQWLSGEVLAEQGAYWQQMLEDGPALIELPTDHRRPVQQEFAGATVGLELDEGLTQGLKALSQRHGLTLFMTVLAGFALVLSRLSNQEDIVIGTPSANRGRLEIEGLIGFFVNTLALRVDLSGHPTVNALLERVKALSLEAQSHQDLPFEQVVELVKPVRSLSHTPVFQVMFAWQNNEGGSLNLPGLQIGGLGGTGQQAAKFDLTLTLGEANGRITGGLNYATSLFEQGTMERWAGYLRQALSQMVADEAQVAASLPILSDAERHKLLVEWNATQAPYPQDLCIHELFEEQVRRDAAAAAVAYEDASLSYGELNQKANRLAHHLIGLGVKPDAPVAICVERSLEMVVGLLAILKAGGAYVPLDPAYPPERLGYMLQDSAPVLVLTHGAARAGLEAALSQLADGTAGAAPLRVVDLDADAADWAQHPATNPDPKALNLTPQSLAYIIYTSGSTGQPKGVMVEHGGVVNLAIAQSSAFGVKADSRVLQFASFSFDAAISEVVMTLCKGACLHLPADDLRLVSDDLVAFMNQHRITHATLPPAVLPGLAEDAALPSLEVLIVAGEAISEASARRWGAGRTLYNAYGPTETTVCASIHRCDPDAEGTPPIGRPMSNTRIYLLDGLGNVVPEGVAGELYIGGAGVARGYLNRADLTAQRFVASPFVGGDRLYRTGDLGRYLADGNIEFLGRNDHQVKIRGFRIELGEIEARLLSHPGVREAVVMAGQDDNGDKRLVGYYTVADNDAAELDAQQLRSHLSASLPEYMVPAAYVRLDALPLTANGKLDRKALPAPEGDAYGQGAYEAPVGPVETALAQIWSEVLGVAQVGRNDDFFALGGHSLLAIKVLERMRRAGLESGVRALFATPVLCELAAALGEANGGVEVPANLIAPDCGRITPDLLPLIDLTQDQIDRVVETVPGGVSNVQDIYPLAPLQEGILFHHLMAGEGDPYLLWSQTSFADRPTLDGYIAALNGVIARHDILRTAVVWEGLPEPVQVVWRQAPVAVEEVVLDAADGDIVQQLRQRFDPRHYRIDVRTAPLMRLFIAPDPVQNRWVMMQLFHHLSTDHTTQEVIRDEIQAYLSDGGSALPPALPFRNFVAQARLGVSRQEHEAFFSRMLGDVDEPTAPFGLMDAQGDGSGVGEARVWLDEGLCERLRIRARALGVSAASLCHVAWGLVLARTSGQQDPVFGTVLFGRMQGGEGADRVLGLFINTLPVRMRLGELGVEQSVLQAHQLLAELLHHEHASLALAQRCSAVPAPAPLFTALLNYRHSSGPSDRSAARQAFQGVKGLAGEERTNYPVTLSVEDLGKIFGLTAQAVMPLDPKRLCAMMARALEQLVEALESNPAQPVGRLDILPPAERHKLLVEWNATQAPYPQDLCIHELFEEQVRRDAAAAAVAYEDVSLSYGELNQKANRLAHHLIGLGVKPDAPVAICVERSLEMVVGLLAILKAGGAYVPLDPAYPPERLGYMLQDSAPVLVLTHGAARAGLEAALSQLADGTAGAAPLRVVDLDADAADWAQHPATNPDPKALNLTPQSLAYIIYTSGSTGQPKGVMVEHGGVLRLLINNGYTDFGPDDRVALASNPAFDASTLEVWGALLSGASLVAVAQSKLLDQTQFYLFLEAQKITCLWMTAGLFSQYCHALADVLSGLRYLIVGGDVVDRSAAAIILCQRPQHFINGYGPTETTTFAATHEITENSLWNNTIPIGRPISNTRIYLLDGLGNVVPEGVAGELYIGGAGVARGYLNRADLTAQRFVASPFVGGDRLYRTGDLGRYLADGNIEFLGRNDHQVKIRGFRIELGEIEARLLSHPGVREAVVMAGQDDNGDKRLVGYYTVADNDAAELDAQQLRSHLSASLPEYMVPAAYVRLDALPLTANGKLDRKALPAPEGDAYGQGAYEAPVGPVETALAQIWSEVLGVAQVGRNDSFFALGGHSLLAIKVLERMRRAGLESGVRALFATPVLCELAKEVATGGIVAPPIAAVDRAGLLTPSFAQQRLWFLAQLEGVSEAYHIPLGLRLRGDLNESALRRALDCLVARHETLRTSFYTKDGELYQRIGAEDAGFTLRFEDLSGRADGAEELVRQIREEGTHPFDLEQGPLIRGRLLRLGDQEHVLLITMHHIVSDGWSMGILSRELGALYEAYSLGKPDPLAPLEIQYADYASWQRQWLSGEVLAEQGAYWQQMLEDGPALIELPTDHRRPVQQEFAGATVGLELDEGLTQGLKALSQRHGLTLFMTVLAGFALVLSRLSNQEDIVIGTPSANRGRLEIEGLIGFFVNTLALRVDLSGHPTVNALLERVKALSLEAQSHQDLPFEQVVELVKPVRSLSHTPVFQVMFAWQNNEGGSLNLPGLQIGGLGGTGQQAAKFDLTLTLGEANGRITGGLNYATSLFEQGTMERWAGYLRQALSQMVADEAQVAASLPILSDAERHKLLVEWNATQAPYPQDLCIHELFEEQVRRDAAAAAVAYEDVSLSYGELNQKANRLAHHLIGLGVKPDAPVAICVERSLEMVVGLLAILKAGGAYVPLDPAYPPERLGYMLQDSAPVLVLTHGAARAGLEAALSQLADGTAGAAPLRVVDLDADAADWAQHPATNPDPKALNLTPQSLAYIIYTSGSTGQPKGVMNAHDGVTNRLLWMQDAYRIDGKDAILQKTPFSFDVSVWEFFWTLLAGAKLVMARPQGHTDPDYLTSIIRQERISVTHFVPSMLRAFLEAKDAGTCLSLAKVFCSGEALAGQTVERFHDLLGAASLHNLYGPTEAAIDATAWDSRDGMPEAASSPPIGRPISNTRIYLLDGLGNVVPEGVAGELYIGGAGVARGYLNRADLTAQRFVASPFVGGDRLYRTGDLGRYLADGNIEFLGRNDHQVKIRGFRIELGEIEARLLSHPGVREAVVMAGQDDNGDKRLVGYYTVADNDAAELDAQQLRSHLSASLPEYMVPAAYVRLDALPLTANGKLDRKALPAPEGDAYGQGAYEAPVGPVETALAQIWSEVLGVAQVGRNDDFFALGGHSLLAIKVLERMRRAGLESGVRALFATPVLCELAAALGEANGGVEVPANLIAPDCGRITPDLLPLIDLTQDQIDRVVETVPGGVSNVQDIYPLAPLQEGILFHHLMAGEGDPYLLWSQTSFADRPTLDGYIAALNGVIARHDILRTAVVWEGLPEPVQVVWRQAPVAVEEVVLDAADGDIVQQLRQRFDPRHYRIDVRTAPLMRLFIAPDPVQNRWVMMQLLHHLVDDATSLKMMRDEIQGYLSDGGSALPPALPFRNFVAQARLGVSRQEHEAFFSRMLGDVDEPTAPFGLMDAQGDGSGVGEARVWLDEGLCERLRIRARALGVSAASLCHVAWGLVLARTSGQQDPVFGTVLFGRMQGGEGADRVLGLFINTLPVRMRLGELGVEQSVLQAHQLLAELLHHEHASLALAQRCSAVPAPAPLFTALLNYRHSSGPSDRSAARQAFQGVKGLAGEERTNYPVTLSVEDLGKIFGLTAQAVMPLDPKRLCAMMARALEQLVEALESNPAQPVGRLDILPPAERHKLLVEWNATQAPYPQDLCIHELFEEQVRRDAAAAAVAYEDASLSYGELNQKANRLAHHLIGLGVKPDAPVAICVERSLEMVVGLLAILKAGGAYVPLDPAYPPERLGYMLQDSAPVLVLTHGAARAGLEAALSQLADGTAGAAPLRVVDLDADAADWAQHPATNPDPKALNLTPQSLAYIIYTSGSTGQPKGVMVEHGNITNHTFWFNERYSLTKNDCVLQRTPNIFDASIWELLSPLAAGAKIRLIWSNFHGDLSEIKKHLSEDVTILQCVPLLLAALIEEWGTLLAKKLRIVFSGGDALTEKLIYEFNGRSIASLHNLYGPTEAAIDATAWDSRDGMPEAASSPPIGRPISNTRIYLLDGLGNVVPEGVAGELYIGGAGVARGYLNRADLTAQRFVASPFVGGDRLYRTGDLGRYLADGNIEFLGRNDHQVKIRGFRIELGEIEARLLSHPGVREAVVMAGQDDNGDKRLVGYYTVADNDAAELDAQQLRSHLSASLPEYMVPAAYVRLDALPLTANGKLDRKALPAPEGDAYGQGAYEAPVGPVETALAQIWSEVLGVAQVGRNDSFFALGGHSLLAIKVLERMRRAGLESGVRALFATPVLCELAAALGEANGGVEVPANLIAPDCGRITPDLLPLIDLTQDQIDRVVETVPGGVSNVQDIYPLAPLQEGILFHHLMAGEGDPYLLWSQTSFADRPTLDGYIAALNGVIARHDILRTAVVWEGLPEPVQVVWRQAPVAVEEVVLDAADGDIVQQLRQRFDPRHYRIDVRTAPLMRLFIAPDPVQNRWVMMQLFHHLSTDHTTQEVIRDEIQAYLSDGGSALPPALPFRNFVAQARLGVSRQEHEAFFSRMLGDVDEPTAPFGLMDAQGDGSGVGEARVWLDEGLCERLRIRARALGVSAASLCHVAWGLVLARTSGQQDPVFGTVLFGRMQGGEGADRVLGLFINTLPVRMRLGELGVEQSVLQAHQLLAELLHHEHASLALAQRCSAVPAPAPLFTALLNYRHSSGPSDRSAARQAFQGVKGLAGEERTNYPVTLSVEDLGKIFGLTAQAVMPLDPKRLCAMMARALEQLVEALESNPAQPVGRLDILPPAERHKLLVEWNATQAPYPQDLCIHELFEEQVRRDAAAAAVAYEDVSLSYGELNQKANRLAHHLIGLGVKPDAPVAICVERSLEMVVGLLAILKAGGAYVPLDPAYPPERLGYMLQDSAPVLVLTHGAARAGLEAALSQLADGTAGAAPLRVVDLDADAADWAQHPATNPDPKALNLTPQSLAYIIYTSGSTGQPKGVMVEHGNITNHTFWFNERYSLTKNDCVLQRTPNIFDASIWELLSPLAAGAKIRLIWSNFHGDLSEIKKHLSEDVTILQCVPLLLAALIEEWGTLLAKKLRIVFSGGDALTEKLIYEFNGRSIASLHNLYGPTEAAIDATAWDSRDGMPEAASSPPIGRPISNTRIYLLDGLGNVVPEGVAGELYIGGAGVARGYLNRADLTAQRFVASPFVGGDRLYRTGDLGRYLADGNIEFLGRNDHQVKIRGFRIELGEIEARLLSHPGVREAVVMAGQDDNGDKRLVGYYTVADNDAAELDAQQLRSHLSASLPEYMVPAAYVRLDALPLTANGKLDRKALPAPEGDAYGQGAYEAPVGPVETALAQIWSEVLGVAQVGRNDDFFALGGHSLLAIKVLERMRRAGLESGVRALFATPVLCELAAALGEANGGVEVPANLIAPDCGRITPDLLPLIDLTQDQIDRVVETVPGGVSNVQDIYPLAPLQEGILFHHLMAGEGDPYLLWSQTSFADRPTLDGYIAALNGVIARHDILRTAVVWEGLPEPVQVVWRQAPVAVEEVVLDAADGDIVQQLRQRFDPRHYRIDVRTAPLMRLFIAPDPVQNRWVMMQLFHHLSTDHTTQEVIRDEIQAYLSDGGSALPPALPFRNFVAQARLGVSRQEHEAFFSRMLGDVDEPTAPFGLMDAQGDGSGVGEARVWLDEGLCERLRIRARALGVSAASLCHVAWGLVLARTSGQQDPVFGTVLFGRMQGGEGADRVLGLFINTLPVRMRLGELGVEQSVLQAHQLLAELLHHEHASLALAQRCSAVPAPAPLFTALLNYRHSSGPSDRSAARQAFQGVKGLAGEERTNYPVTLSVEDLGKIFGLTAQAVMPLDPKRLCAMMARALEQLVEALESNPAQPVGRLDILPPAERHKLLVEWNATQAPYPQDLCIHELFEEQVRRDAAAAAVAYEDASLSYGELNQKANRLAHHLIGLGVKPDAPVAICVERSLEMVVGLLAILKAGGAYVPLDPAYPPERLGYMLQDSAPVLVLTHGAARAGLEAALSQLADGTAGAAPLRVVDLDADAADWAQHPATNPDPKALNLTPQSLAYIIYTSGSTGQPKGVMVEHGGVVNLASWHCATFELGENDRCSSLAGVGFDAAAWEIWPCFIAGACILLCPSRASSQTLLKWWKAQKLSVSFLPTPLAETAFSEDEVNPNIHKLLVGGDRLTRLPKRLPDTLLVNNYGPTECTVVATSVTLQRDASHIPIGRPISNTRIYLLDGLGNVVPEGVAGELYIGGAGVARGYLNRADLTAQRFVASPFVGGDRLYRTGDLGRYLADGNIEFLGRNDHQVKIRGFRIELGEIEARLLSHPGVREAVVMAGQDDNGDKRLVGYYTVADNDAAELDAQQLRSHLSASLPEYMVPAAYVRLDALPLTANGKLDRKALPAPEGDAYGQGAYEAPVGPVETALAQIWSEVLGVAQVGRNDSFFALGGHSLLALRVMSRVRELLKISFPPTLLFEESELSKFSDAILSEIARRAENITWS